METNINITSGLSAEKQTAIVPNNGYSGYGSLNKNEIMKIQDFRIGNYILDGGEFATVELINGEMEEVYFKGQKIYLSENIQYIVPIPINEKWLLDFGFEKTLDNEFTLRYDLKNDARFYYYLPRHNLKTFGLRFKGSTFFDEVKYVHQLQNFYFALTGNELVYENKKK